MNIFNNELLKQIERKKDKDLLHYARFIHISTDSREVIEALCKRVEFYKSVNTEVK